MESASTFVRPVDHKAELSAAKSDRETMRCTDEERHRTTQEDAADDRLLSRMLLAQREEATGSYIDYDEFAARLKAKHGLS